jgi:hypothetical protein
MMDLEAEKEMYERMDAIVNAIHQPYGDGEGTEEFAELLMTLTGTKIIRQGKGVAHDPDLMFAGRMVALRWLKERKYI